MDWSIGCRVIASLLPPSGVRGGPWVSSQDTVGCTPHICKGNRVEVCHVYLPDAIGQLLDGRLFIAEAGLEQDKRQERNRVKAEAARKVVERQGGVYWIGTEATLSRTRHANLVFLHARRQTFPSWQELEEALAVMWPRGEAACVQEVAERIG